MLNQSGRNPNFHFYGSNRSVIYPSEFSCNEVLDSGPTERRRRLRGPVWARRTSARITYDCVDEECQFKHLLFQNDRPPFCHCVEEGEGDWFDRVPIYFVECC